MPDVQYTLLPVSYALPCADFQVDALDRLVFLWCVDFTFVFVPTTSFLFSCFQFFASSTFFPALSVFMLALFLVWTIIGCLSFILLRAKQFPIFFFRFLDNRLHVKFTDFTSRRREIITNIHLNMRRANNSQQWNLLMKTYLLYICYLPDNVSILLYYLQQSSPSSTTFNIQVFSKEFRNLLIKSSQKFSPREFKGDTVYIVTKIMSLVVK